MNEPRPEHKTLDSARSGLVAAIVVSVLLIWLLHFTGFDLTSGALVPFYVVMLGYIVLCVVQMMRAKKAVNAPPTEVSEEGCTPSRVDQQLMYSKMGLTLVTLIFALAAPLISEAYAPLWDRPMAYIALVATLGQSIREYRNSKR